MTSCTSVRSLQRDLAQEHDRQRPEKGSGSTSITGGVRPSRAGSQAMKTPTKPIATAIQRSSGTSSSEDEYRQDRHDNRRGKIDRRQFGELEVLGRGVKANPGDQNDHAANQHRREYGRADGIAEQIQSADRRAARKNESAAQEQDLPDRNACHQQLDRGILRREKQIGDAGQHDAGKDSLPRVGNCGVSHAPASGRSAPAARESRPMMIGTGKGDGLLPARAIRWRSVRAKAPRRSCRGAARPRYPLL